MAYQRKIEKDIRCPLEYGLDVFGGKWSSRIICVLAHKDTLRYSEIRKGKTVVPILQSICNWAGISYRDDEDFIKIHCKKCDYKGKNR